MILIFVRYMMIWCFSAVLSLAIDVCLVLLITTAIAYCYERSHPITSTRNTISKHWFWHIKQKRTKDNDVLYSSNFEAYLKLECNAIRDNLSHCFVLLLG